MANAYTPGFHLNQWAAEDSFLREEFNNDNRILDETLLGLAGRTDLLERQVKPLGLEVYNLMLQNYYEGKETGYRQALAFDGFQDSNFLASVTPGAYHDAAQKQIRILPDVPNFSTGFAAEPGYDDKGDSNRERFVFINWTGSDEEASETSFVPTGFGTLQQVKMRLACGTVTSKDITLTQDYRKAIAWVRHTGTVGIKVRDSAGGYTDLVQESVRNTEELNGNACQESTFSVLLPDGTKNTSTAVQMVLTRGSDGTGVLYDYGAAFL